MLRSFPGSTPYVVAMIGNSRGQLVQCWGLAGCVFEYVARGWSSSQWSFAATRRGRCRNGMACVGEEVRACWGRSGWGPVAWDKVKGLGADALALGGVSGMRRMSSDGFVTGHESVDG